MKINLTTFVTLLITMVVCLSSLSSYARTASPPPQLTNIFEDLSRFEAAYKSDNWDRTIKALDGIEIKFKRMMPQLKRDLYGFTENDYQNIINNIRLAVRDKSSPKIQIHFIELHNWIFFLIAKYDYNIPPLITIINKYIHEADEAVKLNKYNRVVSEMDEILGVFPFVEHHLLRIDTMRSEGEKIKAKLQEIRSAAINKQSITVKDGISSLKKMMAELLPEIKRTEKLFK